MFGFFQEWDRFVKLLEPCFEQMGVLLISCLIFFFTFNMKLLFKKNNKFKV